MKPHTTITLPAEAFEAFLGPYLETWKAEYFAKLPQPDPQYPVAMVAEILGFEDEGTVRGYMRCRANYPPNVGGFKLRTTVCSV